MPVYTWVAPSKNGATARWAVSSLARDRRFTPRASSALYRASSWQASQGGSAVYFPLSRIRQVMLRASASVANESLSIA